MDYFTDIRDIGLKIEATASRGKKLPADEAVSKVIDSIIASSKKGNKVMFIGNGGSASIASHFATDFLKNAKIPALAFNDPSLLTCISNDLGYEYVFEKPIEMLAKPGDILFSISSSGKSRNILNGTSKAKEKGCLIVTLSGFSGDNPLRAMGDINFYVPSDSYGYVEILHMTICHSIVDSLVKKPLNG